MAQTIKLKRSATSGSAPAVGDLELGEIAINTTDGRIFTKRNDGSNAVIEMVSYQWNGGTSGNLTRPVMESPLVFDTTESIQIPVGTTAQRPATPTVGDIRYNSDLSSFEGFGPGNAWGSLGGVKDVDQDTYIVPESSAGADEDTLSFYTGGQLSATLDSTGLTAKQNFNVDGNTTIGNAAADTLTVTATSTFNGAVSTTGNTILGNAAADTLTVNATTTFKGPVTSEGGIAVRSGDAFTFGQGANRKNFADTTRMTVSNEGGTLIFDGYIFVE